ncbi:MAG: hypothetical protein M1837_001512 [Sclerophora amabilis]|nr:MAG: hypothetical protein M1837_001512 [Sclerophora amabilis]
MEPVYPKLVSLGKSTEPFSDQIREACGILGIDKKTLHEIVGEKPAHLEGARFTGREEYILRWLLGKLQAADTEGAVARSLPKAWLLLLRLISAIPSAITARVLKGSKFIQIIDTAFKELLARQESRPDRDAHSLTRDQESTSSSKSDSSTIQEEVVVPGPSNPPKKRKRSDSSTGIAQGNSNRRQSRKGAGDLFIYILQVLNRIVDLSIASHSKSESNSPADSSEYMRSVLRTDSETAARILGRALRLDFLATPEFDRHSMLFKPSDSLALIKCTFVIWDQRSKAGDDNEHTLSNRHFAYHCLVPALLKIGAGRNGLISSSSKPLNKVEALEQLLARHIVLPAKMAFHRLEGSHVMWNRSDSGSRYGELFEFFLKPLRLDNRREEEDSAATISPSYQALESIVILFSTALRCSNSGVDATPTAQAGWHQALFLSLVESAGISTTIGDPREIHALQDAVLSKLLQISLENHVSLDTDLLRTFVVNYSEIFRAKDLQVNWSLVENIISLDSNVFLIPASIERTPSLYRTLENPLLERLFAELTLANGKEGSIKWANGSYLQHHILLPIMEAFSKARNLTGFIRYWQEELVRLERERFDQSELAEEAVELSIWEDEEIPKKLRQLLEPSLTAHQIFDVLESMSRSLKIDGTTTNQGKVNAFANLVIVDALFQSFIHFNTAESLGELIESVYLVVLEQATSGTWDEAHRWRLWRILGRAHQTTLADTVFDRLKALKEDESGTAKASMDLALHRAEQIMDEVTSAPWESTLKSHRYREAYEAFNFTCGLSNGGARILHLENSVLRSIDALVQKLNVFAENLKYIRFDFSAKRSGVTIWPDILQGIGPPGECSMALITLVITKHSNILLQVTPDTRKRFIRFVALGANAFNGTVHGPSPLEFAFEDVWKFMLHHDCILNSSSLKDDLVYSTLDCLELQLEDDNPKGDGSAGIRDFAVNTFLQLPIQTLNRKQREIILNKILEAATTHRFLNRRDTAQKHLGLMIKLMQLPNASSILVTEVTALWWLADAIQSVDQDEDHLFGEVACEGLEQLVSLTLRYHLSNKTQERSQQYLSNFCRNLIEDVPSIRSLVSFPLKLSLIKTSLEILWPHRHELSKALEAEGLEIVQRRHINTLISDLKLLRGQLMTNGQTSGVMPLGRLLKAISGTIVLRKPTEVESRQTIIEEVNKILDIINPSQQDEDDKFPHYWRYRDSLRCFSVLAVAEQPLHSSIHRRLAQFLCHRLRKSDREELLTSLRLAVDVLDDDQRLAFLKSVGDEAAINEAPHDIFVLLQVLISSVNNSTDEARSVLARVYYVLCEKLWCCNDFRNFRIVVNCLIDILCNKSWSISQWSIEISLSSIVLAASRDGHAIDPQHSGTVFLHLCMLFSFIINMHRVRLRGRYHLVLQVLRSLLRCLFPSTDPGSSRAAAALPSSPALPSKFPPSSSPRKGEMFARLLTNLCDPTVSSVGSSSQGTGRHQLTPATDKASRLAGQYLPYLLMEYAECQLRSPMLPDVRAALLPGLYVILDVTEQETLRMVNEAMEAEGRAVFKGLYEEWKRFGRGREV